MSIKKTLSAAGLAFTLAFSTAAGAKNLSDFDSDSVSSQSRFVGTVLSKIFDHFNSKDETRFKAQCMADLYNTKSTSGNSRLMDLINLELGKARRAAGKDPKVENIIYGVVLHECKATNIAGTPAVNPG